MSLGPDGAADAMRELELLHLALHDEEAAKVDPIKTQEERLRHAVAKAEAAMLEHAAMQARMMKHEAATLSAQARSGAVTNADDWRSDAEGVCSEMLASTIVL